MMRILGVSDIHGRIEAVKRLRALETNRFDALVVAGDIGSGLESAVAAMEILATFRCPVLYVFGNHDCDLPYDLPFADGCRHLHGHVIELGGHAFAGYSGVSDHWGLNPFAMTARAEIEHLHTTTLAMLAELETAQSDALARLREQHAKRISPPSEGSRAGHKLTRRMKCSRSDEGCLRDEARIRRPLQAALAGERYATYRRAVEAADRIVLERNRAQLAELIAGRDPRNVVVTTHDRQRDTNQDMPNVALFLFGHRHGYADTKYRGARFVNVSALDRIVTMMPSGSRGGLGFLRSLRGADLGSYAVMELSRDGEVVATCQRLYADPEGWEICRDFQMQTLMIAQGDPK